MRIVLPCLPALMAASSACSLSGPWSYLPASAFNHSLAPQGQPRGWNAFQCAYVWKESSASSSISFTSPIGCLGDQWSVARGVLSGAPPQRLALSFVSAKANATAAMHGTVSATCDFIDMDDGSLFTRGVHPVDQSDHAWLRSTTAWLVRAATITFTDGTRHLTPGYPTHYNGQWMRDSFYGIKHAWDVVNSTHRADYAASLEWMLSHARADGILPQMCPPRDDPLRHGRCDYGSVSGCNDTVGAPGWHRCQDLDTASFAIKLAAHLWGAYSMPNRKRAQELYAMWGPTLLRSLNATTTAPDDSSLLWSNTTRPVVNYGFQDTEVQSGAVLYSSLLAWNATRLLAGLERNLGSDAALAAMLDARAERIRVAADAQLWDGALGVYRAATGISKSNIDVWGNAMAAAAGFANGTQQQSIFRFFQAHEADIFYEGQVRETPAWQQWEQVRSVSGQTYGDEPPQALATARTYQNGGYWATPHHHVLPFLAQHDRTMACRLLNATIASFRGRGIFEWVGPFYPALSAGAPGYVASAANTLFASAHLRCHL